MSASIAVALLSSAPTSAGGSREVTLIHVGDLHGHLLPRPSVRDGKSGQTLGGLARIYSCWVLRNPLRCQVILRISRRMETNVVLAALIQTR